MNQTMEKLKQYLEPRIVNGAALAFSGGVDSSVLLEILRRLREDSPFPLIALSMYSVFQKDEELEEIRRAADAAQVELVIFDFDPLSLPAVKNNPPDRCYHCKYAVFSHLKSEAESRGIGIIMDGTNADDLKVYRPGRTALQELGVVSPFAELGITKKEIREMAAELGLSCASKPAAPCLATRFEYGTVLSGEAIHRVAQGEEFLHSLFPEARTIRLRVHGTVARIELPDAQISEAAANREEIVSALKELGFHYVTLDLEGFRSGSMDLDLDLTNP